MLISHCLNVFVNKTSLWVENGTAIDTFLWFKCTWKKRKCWLCSSTTFKWRKPLGKLGQNRECREISTYCTCIKERRCVTQQFKLRGNVTFQTFNGFWIMLQKVITDKLRDVGVLLKPEFVNMTFKFTFDVLVIHNYVSFNSSSIWMLNHLVLTSLFIYIS